MKTAELHNKSTSELQAELLAQLKGQFELKMKKSTGQLAQTHLLKQSKKNIARIKTVLNSKAGKTP